MSIWPQAIKPLVLVHRKTLIRSHRHPPRQLYLESAQRLTLRRKLQQTIRPSTRRWTTRLPWTRLFTWYRAVGSAVAGATSRLIQKTQDSSKTLTEWTALAWEQTPSRNVTARSCVAELLLSTRQAISQPSAKASPTIRQPTGKTLSSRGKSHISLSRPNNYLFCSQLPEGPSTETLLSFILRIWSISVPHYYTRFELMMWSEEWMTLFYHARLLGFFLFNLYQ